MKKKRFALIGLVLVIMVGAGAYALHTGRGKTQEYSCVVGDALALSYSFDKSSVHFTYTSLRPNNPSIEATLSKDGSVSGTTYRNDAFSILSEGSDIRLDALKDGWSTHCVVQAP